MRERPEQILKFVCLALAALVLFQIIRVILAANPLARVVVPALPSLADESSTAGQGTMPSLISTGQTGQNRQSDVNTNLTALATNVPARAEAALHQTNSSALSASALVGTNAIAPQVLARAHRRSIHSHNGSAVQLADATSSMPGMKKPTVTPAIQASIDRISDSEILGPVVRPLPMALLGIAGDVAFLRAPNGMTGLVKEGDNLGDIKLLRIGVNRVLVEQDGQQKELTIFDGVGGQTLLDKSLKSSHENNNQ